MDIQKGEKMKEKQTFYQAIAKGSGGLKYYNYWTGGIILRDKKTISKAFDLKLRVIRHDKITGQVELFNYTTLKFEKVTK